MSDVISQFLPSECISIFFFCISVNPIELAITNDPMYLSTMEA